VGLVFPAGRGGEFTAGLIFWGVLAGLWARLHPQTAE
jgi:hypothetical protein